MWRWEGAAGLRTALGVVWGLGAALGEIAAAERGNDGTGEAGMAEEGRGATEAAARADTRGKRGYDEVGAGMTERGCGRGGGGA